MDQALKNDLTEKMNKAIEEDDKEAALKFAGQTVRVTSQMTEDAKRLIKALGLPCIEAPGEAEAQCTYLVKHGHAYAVASEDMDCLTFGTERMIRGFNSKDEPVTVISLKDILKDLEITMDQFIDICILCGCDYTGTISNIGPIKAYNFIKEHERIEKVLEFVDDDNVNNTKKKTKYEYTLDNFKYEEVRKEFNHPLVLDDNQINIAFSKPDEEEIKKFLIEEKGFSENRIISALSRLESAKNKSNQGRIDSFFKVKEIVPSTNKSVSNKKDEKKSNKKKNVIY
jgi:flap endonuclease-1